MRLLWIATKSPWPPIDGGRRLLLSELEALAAAGVALTLVAPCPGPDARRAEARRRLSPICRPVLLPVGPRSWPVALALAAGRGLPATVARHTHAAVRLEAARIVVGEAPDAVVAQPLQAWIAAATAVRRRLAPAGTSAAPVPLLLRAENVESELWAARAASESGWRAALFRREARRLARFEAAAVRDSRATLALSPEDAAGLAALLGGGAPGTSDSARGETQRVHVLRPAFPATLPAGEALAGSPPIVLFGSAGWGPNREAERWFLTEVWPRIRALSPAAVLHRFAADARSEAAGEGVVDHPAPRESAEAFASGAVLVLPLRSGSGVRVRLLEAWARGVAVVGTAAAVRGLAGVDGRDWLLAADADGFAEAIRRLREAPELAERLIAGGRQRLGSDHDPSAMAAALRGLVEGVVDRPGAAR